MFFQPEIETMPRRDLEALQLERLKWTVDYCYRNVPFYTKKLDEAGARDYIITQRGQGYRIQNPEEASS